jgi:acyl carrier protein
MPIQVFLSRPMHAPTVDAILELLQEQDLLSPDISVNPETDLFSSGLDSLALMQLLVALEHRFGAVVDPMQIQRDKLATPQKIALWLQGAANTGQVEKERLN